MAGSAIRSAAACLMAYSCSRAEAVLAPANPAWAAAPSRWVRAAAYGLAAADAVLTACSSWTARRVPASFSRSAACCSFSGW